MVERDSMRQGSRAARLSAIAFAGFVVTGVMLAAAPLGAANYTWVVSSGDWSVASNWNGTLPTSIDYAYVNNGGTAAVSQTNETCGTLSLGGSGSVQMFAGGMSTSYQYVGDSGLGTFTQLGGTNQSSQVLYLGNDAWSSGAYNLYGGVLSRVRVRRK